MTTVARSRLRPPRVKAVPRPRVDDLVDQAWNHRVTLLLAPAGSGKTTAMAAFADRYSGSVAWITCSGLDGSAAGLICAVNAALHEMSVDVPLGWTAVGDAVEWLMRGPRPITLAIDDAHVLVGTEAEGALGALIDDAPESLSVVLATRREPSFELSAVQMMGQLLIVTNEHLRFRSWEAEQLFHDLYDTWLRPDDIARLARRVDGWPAGLQMFHLASRGLNPVEQRGLIERLNGRTRIVREYLAGNVLGPIDPELREFLVDTCVLGVLTPSMADELRDAEGSQRHLRTLVSSQLFTVAIDDDDTYRYHEVLRSHLEVLLVERDGTDRAAARFNQAGLMLERSGYTYDAIRCFARAGDWAAVKRLAKPANEDWGLPTAALINDLPPSIVADDPWLLLSRARAERSAGRWSAAIESFHAAEAKGFGGDFTNQCCVERTELASWLDPFAQAPPGWVALTQSGCRRDPIVAANGLVGLGATGMLAAAALRLLGGDVAAAEAAAECAITDESLGTPGTSAGLALLAITGLLVGAEGADRTLDEAESLADRSGCGWVSRLARAAMSLTNRPQGVDEAVRVRDQCVGDGDPWGAAVAGLFAGLGAARRGQPCSELLGRVARDFRELDAGALEGLCAVVVAEADDSVRRTSEAMVRAGGIAALVPLVRNFIARCPGEPAPLSSVPTEHPHNSARSLEVCCLGRFDVRVFGREISLEALRPRARSLLKMLAIHPESAVHRETIVEALWPEGDAAAGIHNLQVAASAIRKVLSAAGVAENLGIHRTGEAYRLVLSATDSCDLAQFLSESNAARSAASHGEHEAATAAAARALSLYRGELLAEDGPLEWVEAQRIWVAALRESMAAIVAGGHVRAERYREAVDVCEATLLDRPYADELWRHLISANRERGDLAAAGWAQTRYHRVLAELDV